MNTVDKLNIMLEAPISTGIVAYRTFIKEILEEKQKYRWHDLRKNPEDLPPEFQEVLTVDIYGEYMTDHILLCGDSDSPEWMSVTNEKVAWREIDPYGEG